MKRTTIYLAPDLEVRLKTETQRRGQPMAELVREALEVYLAGGSVQGPPGAGEFESGQTDTAGRADEVLGELAFGEHAVSPRRRTSPRPVRRRPKRRP
jgi:hypothetical protein